MNRSTGPGRSFGVADENTAASTSVSNDQLVPATAEVFSASLYLRSLHGRGETHLATRLGLTEKRLKAVDELIEPERDTPEELGHQAR